MDPAVSVVTGTYNHGHYLDGMAASVLGQTFGDLELIVFDDASTDDTPSILRRISDSDMRVRVLRHDGRRVGAPSGMNRAIEHARAAVIAILDADDLWLPQKLELQLPSLSAGASLSYGLSGMIDVDGRRLPGILGDRPDGTGASPLESLVLANYVPWLTAMFPKDAFYRAGSFFENRYWDYDLLLRLVALDQNVVFVPSVLGDYRTTGTGMDGPLLASGMDLVVLGQAVGNLLRWPGLPAALRADVASWERCYSAIVALVRDGDLPPLRPEDGPRLERLLHYKGSRMVPFVDQGSFDAWVETTRRVGIEPSRIQPAIDELRPLMRPAPGVSARARLKGRGLRSRPALRGGRRLVPEATGHVDEPIPGQAVTRGRALVRGWALDPDGPVRAVLLGLGEDIRAVCDVGHPRVDVLERFPEVPGARTSGWSGELNLADAPGTEVVITAWVITARDALRKLGEVRLRLDGGNLEVRPA